MPNELKFVSKGNVRLNYLLAYIAIAFGGIHFFLAIVPIKFGISISLLLIFLYKGKKFGKSFFWIVALFLGIMFIQQIVFDANLSIRNYITFILYYVAPGYLILKIIGSDAPKYIVNILVVYSVISLIFWGLSNLIPSFYSFTETIAPRLGTDPITEVSEQFIIYTYENAKEYGIIRNPGPFNEPGTFALFLIWALIMNTIQNRGKIDNKSKILIVTILTTISSAGFLSLFVFMGFYVFSENVKGVFKFLFILFLVPGIYYAFFELDFLNEKITEQYEWSSNVSLQTGTTGRFLGARKSLYVLQKYPLYGRGLVGVTGVNDPYSAEDASYGILSQAAGMGLIGITFYLVLFWKGLRYYVLKNNFSKRFVLFAFFALMASLFSQNRCETPLFMILVFSSLVFKHKFTKTI